MAKARRRRGRFEVPCPYCGDPHGLAVEVAGMTLFCFACSETVRRADLLKLADDARRLVRWLDGAADA